MLKTVSIIIVRGQEYILQHRDNKEYIADPDTYGVFGGSVDAEDESIKSAAIRELKEETGKDFTESDLQYLGKSQFPARTPKNAGQMVDFYFYALHVPLEMQLETLEGQGIVAIPIPFDGNDKVNDIAKRAIEIYEAKGLGKN